MTDRSGHVVALYRCRRCGGVFNEPGSYVTRFSNVTSNRQAVWEKPRPDVMEHPCHGDWVDATEWGLADKIGYSVLVQDEAKP